MLEAKIINSTPDTRRPPVWELLRRDHPDTRWQVDLTGDSTADPATLRRMATEEGRILTSDASAGTATA